MRTPYERPAQVSYVIVVTADDGSVSVVGRFDGQPYYSSEMAEGDAALYSRVDGVDAIVRPIEGCEL